MPDKKQHLPVKEVPLIEQYPETDPDNIPLPPPSTEELLDEIADEEAFEPPAYEEPVDGEGP